MAMFILPVLSASANIQTLGGLSTQDQTFSSNTSIQVDSSAGVHTLNWKSGGLTPIANGGTNNSAFAVGGLVFASSSKLTQDATNLYYASSSVRFGIGTNTPSFRLDVQGGQINASGGLCIAGVCKTSWLDIASGSANYVPKFSGQSTIVKSAIYDNSGNIGIGNTSPQHKLDVSGSIYSRIYTLTDSSTTAVDWNSANVQSITLNTSNTAFTFSNGQAGAVYKLILKQDATGSRTVTWPVSVKWPGGTAPTLTTTANAIDLVNIVYDGTNYLASSTLNHKAPPMTLFSDDFNRSDSNTIGNGWSEGVYTFWTDEQGYPESNAISGNTARQGSADPTYDGGTISRTYSGQTTDVKITGRFTWVSANAFVFLKSTVNTWASGWGMVLDGSNVIVRDGGSDKASASFSLTGGISYDYEIDVDSNNHMSIYLWATSGSKPGTPTVSFTNGGNPYTTTETGSQLSLTFQTSSSTYGYWDFIQIDSQ